MPCICVAFVCIIFIVSSHPSLLIDSEAADDTAEYDYIVDDPTPSAELPGKQPFYPPDIAYSFSLILALGIAAAVVR